MKNIDKNQPDKSSLPSETLQTYYKDAYMRERERFNSMFGALEYNPVYEEPVYRTPQEQMPVFDERLARKLKKTRKALAVFVMLALVFLGAAAYFGAKYFNLF